ncbi:MAG: B12-binding domain-containing radical SAM protein [Candidatus Aenigmatarchaeota archaeon]
MNILAINPWIYDFAAYDFWLKPYGFLVMLTYLKNKKINIDYFDCLEKKTIKGSYGRSKYFSVIVEKPPIYKDIPRYYKRYGKLLEEFKDFIKDKKPDYILLSSSMTYWYLGIIEAIKILKEKFIGIPIILGGTYASLCYEHAIKNTPTNYIFKNNELEKFFKFIGIEFSYKELYSTLVDYEDFYKNYEYVVLRTSWGCPFSCSYCAIKELFSDFFRIDYQKIIEFILKYVKKGIKNFVLYDDAFLYEKDYVKKLLKEIERLNLDIYFHTPNALHLRFLDEETAYLLKKTGFVNPHFGLETLNPKLQKEWGDKVNQKDLLEGIGYLKKGGFKKGEFSVYLLLGYPGQDLEELKKEAEFLNSLGVKISLSEFSPVPKTILFEKYKEEFFEPLLQNNSIFGAFKKENIKKFWEVKNYVRELNKKLVKENL